MEGFTVAGNSICGPTNSDACNAKLIYLSFDFMARYIFSNDSFRPWIGGGLSLLFPATKEASALDSASISTTNAIVGAFGFDYYVNNTFYIPVSIEYGLLPKSDEVSANWIAFRTGFGLPF